MGDGSDPDAYRFGVDTFQEMNAESDEGEEASQRTSEPFLLGGLGLYFRLSDSFALQPAVTAVYLPETDSFVPRAGISFVFGSQPTWR
jgi:hypothetical protein